MSIYTQATQLATMARTKRVRVKIIRMMEKFGEMDTAEIYDRLNDYDSEFKIHHGITMQVLGNVLSKEPIFLKMIGVEDQNAPRFEGTNGYAYKISLWALNKSLLNAHPELADESTNSYRLGTSRSAS